MKYYVTSLALLNCVSSVTMHLYKTSETLEKKWDSYVAFFVDFVLVNTRLWQPTQLYSKWYTLATKCCTLYGSLGNQDLHSA